MREEDMLYQSDVVSSASDTNSDDNSSLAMNTSTNFDSEICEATEETAAFEQVELPSPEEAAAAASYYGYEEVGGSTVVHTSEETSPSPMAIVTPTTTTTTATTTTSSSMDLMLAPMMTTFQGSSTPNEGPTFSYGGGVPGSPLPADRLARKQRNFPRRGGFCHSGLLKSAVMACMSEGENRSSSHGTDGTNGDLMLPIPNNSMSSSSSPRKRMRRSDTATISANTTLTPQNFPSLSPTDAHRGGPVVGIGGMLHQQDQQRQELSRQKPTADDEAVIARATDLLQRLCVKNLDSSDSPSTRHVRRNPSRSSSNRQNSGCDVDFERKAPVRRVSRRTSYTSQISTGTDFDEFDDDEFH